MEQLLNILNEIKKNFDPLNIDNYQYLLNIIYTNDTVFQRQSEMLNNKIDEVLAHIKQKFFEPYDIEELIWNNN